MATRNSKRRERRLSTSCPSFHLLYNRASREGLAEVPVVKGWKMSPKMHLFSHLMAWQVFEIGLNPRGYWTNARSGWDHGGSEQVVPSFHSCARVSDKVAALGTARRVSGDITIVAN